MRTFITKSLLLLAMFVFTSVTTNAPGATIDMYLVAGQSNAGNFGSRAAVGTTTAPYSLHWGNIEQSNTSPPYVGFKNSFSTNTPNTTTAVGSLANSLRKPGNDIAVYAYARNGTPVALAGTNPTWHAGTNLATGGTPYNSSMYSDFVTWSGARVADLSAGGNTVNVKGIFWFQGERDAVINTHNAYEENFENILLRMRQDFGANIPVVAAKIREVGDAADRAVVNQGLLDLAGVDPFFSVVETEDLTWRSASDVHLNNAGLDSLAPRWASAMLGIQAVPEPSSFLCLAVFGVLGIGRRRRQVAS